MFIFCCFVYDAILFLLFKFRILSCYILFMNWWCFLFIVIQDALAKYDVVMQNIEFAKELQKQFIEISVDVSLLNFII